MKNHFASVYYGFLITFAIWIVWESTIRLLLFHEAWTLSTAFFFITGNLIFYLIVAVLLASFNVMILLFFSHVRKNKFPLSATICLALSFLLTMPVFLWFRTLSCFTEIPARFRGALMTGILCGSCALFFWILYSSSGYWRKRGGIRPIAVLVLFPLILVTAIQKFRNDQFERKQDLAHGIRQIVLISIDTLRYDFVGVYGAKNVRTPTLDRIASEGALFETAISSIPVTGPSHTSIFTGKPPLVHGALTNGQRVPPRTRTLADELRDTGYRTAAFISGYPLKALNCGLDSGFQIYNDRLAFIDRFEEIYLGKASSLLPVFDLGVYRQAHEVTDPAIQWLSKNANHPFFLFLHYFDPHYPYGNKKQRRHATRPLRIYTPPSDVKRQRKLYAEEVESVDSHISRVVDVLKERGIYEETLLIVTADHGESLGEHNYYYDHASYVYEQLLHVPLLLRCPAKIKAGMTFKPQVALFDIYGTVLNAAGIQSKNQKDSVDLIGVINTPPKLSSRGILSHNEEYDICSLRTDMWKLIETKKNSRLRYELYDLYADREEVVNLLAQKKDVSDQLLAEMKQLLNAEMSGENWKAEKLTPEQEEALRSLGYLK